MKTRILLFILVVVCAVGILTAQTTGDFRSKATGNWGDASTWETFNGTIWEDAVSTPSTTSGTTTISGGHIVTIASVLTINGATIHINGYLLESLAITKTSGTWIVNNGGTFELAHTPASNQGIPTATWNDGSTCIVSGVTSSTSGLNAAQDFYNFVWNCDAQTSNLNLAWGVSGGARGNFTVTNSGNTAGTIGGVQIRFGSGTGTVNIGGNLIVNGPKALLSIAGGGTAATVNVQGNIVVSSGAFSMSNASGFVGTVNLFGNYSHSDGALFGKSNAANLSKLIFKKTGIQTVTIGSSATFSNAPSFQVESGSVLDMGTSVFSGAGSFTISAGATVEVGHASGLNGNITTTGVNGGGNSFSTSANYTYNGSGAQVTGSLLPATVNNLTIDNSAGVTNSQEVTVTGTLNLLSGLFDNSVNQITLAEGATLNQTGGSTSQPPLPVELTAFFANVRGKSIELVWNTATELNNMGFDIERKHGSTAWTTVGFVEGNGTSNVPHSYSFVDKVSAPAKYQYRLKQIDRDGQFEYSPTIEASPVFMAEDYALSQNYPNPFNPVTTFSFAVKQAELTTVKVYNLVGQEVATLFNAVAQPDQLYALTFEAKNLPSGIYFYALRSNSRNEVKKMSLIK